MRLFLVELACFTEVSEPDRNKLRNIVKSYLFAVELYLYLIHSQSLYTQVLTFLFKGRTKISKIHFFDSLLQYIQRHVL